MHSFIRGSVGFSLGEKEEGVKGKTYFVRQKQLGGGETTDYNKWKESEVETYFQ